MNSLRGHVEINLRSLLSNLQTLKNLHKDKIIIPVIKTNAYGHGLIEVAKKLQNYIDMVCVLSVEEGIRLREERYKKDILILSSVYPIEKHLKAAIDYNLIPTISSTDELKILKKITARYRKKQKFHLKIDTGMHRMGILPIELPQLLELLSESPSLELSGIFTHLSSADSDKAYTHHQIETFNSAIKIIEKFGFKPKLIHAANSSASILYKQAHYSALRPGIALYGLLPFKGADKLINIKPVLSWKTKLILIKTLPKGSAISYGQTFVTKRKTKLGVISVGYADGYSRLLSNKGYVLVKGKKVPILGRVTMDLTMIDLTDVHNAKVGDEVVLIGSQGKEKITAEELAELTQTINYEVVCRVHPRVKRIYIDD